MSSIADKLRQRLYEDLDNGAFPGEVRAFPPPGPNQFGQPSGFQPAKGPHGPKHRTLRWGSNVAYQFNADVAALVPSPPAPSEVIYFSSTLLAAPRVKRPLVWRVHAQVTFNLDSSWLNDTNDWFFVVSAQPGVGQSNNTVQKVYGYTPSTGDGTSYGTDPTFQDLPNAYWPLDFQVDISAEHLYVNLQIYGPAPTHIVAPPSLYTGIVSAWAAPYFIHPEETTE